MKVESTSRQLAVAFLLCLGFQAGPATATEPTVLTPWDAPSQQPGNAYRLEPASYALVTQSDTDFEPVTTAVYSADGAQWDRFVRRSYYDVPSFAQSFDQCVYAGFLKLPSTLELMPPCRRTPMEDSNSI